MCGSDWDSNRHGGGRGGHGVSVGSVGAGVLGAYRVGDGVLLTDAPGPLSVPLGLGKVALTLILQGFGLTTGGLVALEGGVQGSANRANRMGCGGGGEWLGHLGCCSLSVTSGLTNKLEKNDHKRREYLLSVFYGLVVVSLTFPLECLGLKPCCLLLCCIGNHDVAVLLLLSVVCHLADHGSDVSLESRRGVGGVTNRTTVWYCNGGVHDWS